MCGLYFLSLSRWLMTDYRRFMIIPMLFVTIFLILVVFFFSSRRRHTRCLSDWSSDVCSSDLFWLEVAGKGPLIESIPGNDRDLLVTFLWRATYETHNVLARWPMADWRADDYYMSHLANTDVWYKTIQVGRGSRFSYWLSPNLRAGPDRFFADQLDPLNPRVFPDDPNSMVDLSSVLETPGAPDESFVRRTPVRRGAVEHKTLRLVGNDSEMWVYTPPGYAATAG